MTRPANIVGRVLIGVLVFQIALAVLLVAGDLGDGLRLPGLGLQAPDITQPVRPGDQTRRFQPSQPRPVPGDPLPERLVLTAVSGGDAILLEGGIRDGDADRIAKQIDDLPQVPERALLNSPGGSVRDALSLGRILRSAGMATEMREGDICFSACPYLLAAGVSREVPDTASVGVHQHYFGESTLMPAFVAVEDIQRGQSDVMRYLHDMGIDPLVMSHAMATPPDEIYVLLPEELQRYGFTQETDE